MSEILVEDKRATKMEYAPSQAILDRIIVERITAVIHDDGFEVPEKYRQQSSWGEVVSVGDCIVLGNECVQLTDFVRIGDKVRYSEYTAEKLEPTDEADHRFIVRLQDVRCVQRKLNA